MKKGLHLKGIRHHFGSSLLLSNIDLEVEPGEIVCLVGPSGSGKTTLLRLVAGLEGLQVGEIWLHGELLATSRQQPPPEKRSIGLVFQDHVLFPHMSVLENISFGLPRMTKDKRRRAVEDRLQSVGLAGFADRFPHTLSGGEQQRIALARALATEPDVMLMDEPFASVDVTLKRRLREDARLALKSAGVATLMVTHDPEEALAFGDRIAVIVGGSVIQNAIPEELCRNPADRFIAELFGAARSFIGIVRDKKIATDFGELTDVKIPDGMVNGDKVDVVVRPESVALKEGPGVAQIRDIRYSGESYLLILTSGASTLHGLSGIKPAAEIGSTVGVTFESSRVLVYSRK